MFAFFKSRAFVLLIGFLLIAIFIWYAGPYFAFGTYYPLETEFSRLVAIGLVVVCWIVSRLIKRLRSSRASERLVGAVIAVTQKEKERPSAEATKLRERFEEAVGALSKGQKPGRSLYDLPWYVFIGAPGSGKTTALVNSGLKFPADQRGSKAAVRGVGGTRNCDWWFTDEAVFLDTAGRYTTQDSDASSDSEGWREFLALLTRYRQRRPVNGIILTISTQDLLTQGDAGREAHVDAARRRLTEFTRELQIQLPVYLMVTKCDMVAGFSEYFDDLTQEDRAQVWGVTFPYDQSVQGDAADAFPEEFDALIGRLNERVYARLEEERGPRRRANIFAFPQQMVALRDPLTQFVSDIFSSTSFNQQILLRGVYLTSGTQDGTQIDRLLGSIGRRFGVAADAVAPAAGRGKAFFMERLLKQVVIGESGLAGVNRRLEMRTMAWQLGAYAAVLLFLIGSLLVLSVSYANNRDYLAQVATDLTTLRSATPALPRASLEVLLPQLNAVRAVSDSANRYRDSTPWGMRWGLYQGNAVGNAARDAYLRELDGIVLPRFAARIKQHLVGYAAEPEKLYVYLKAYLMLGDPKHLDKKYLQSLADVEWKMPDAAPGAGTSLSNHFQNLLAYSDTLRPIALDPSLVAQARSTILRASIPQMMFEQLRRSYTGETKGALQLDVIAGAGIEKVLRRKSGRKLSEPVPAFYTKQVFNDATGTGMAPLVKQFAEETWVWGPGAMSAASWPKLTSQVTELYERDYNRYWDELLNDLEIVQFSTVQQVLRRAHDPGRTGFAAPRSAENGRRANVPRDRLIRYDCRGAEWGWRQDQERRGRHLLLGAEEDLRDLRPRARHGDHAALRAHSSLHGRSARADRRDVRADPQDSRSAGHARPAGGRHKPVEGARRSGVARPASGAATGCGEPASTGQYPRGSDGAERGRQHQHGCDPRAREAVSGRGRQRVPRARGRTLSIRRRRRYSSGGLRLGVRSGRSVRQVLRGAPRQARRHVSASLVLAS